MDREIDRERERREDMTEKDITKKTVAEYLLKGFTLPINMDVFNTLRQCVSLDTRDTYEREGEK